MSPEQERLHRKHNLLTDKRYKVSGVGDLGIVAEARPFIGEVVEVKRKLKSGLYIVQLPDGRTHPIPKSNLWPIEEETYDYPTE